MASHQVLLEIPWTNLAEKAENARSIYKHITLFLACSKFPRITIQQKRRLFAMIHGHYRSIAIIFPTNSMVFFPNQRVEFGAQSSAFVVSCTRYTNISIHQLLKLTRTTTTIIHVSYWRLTSKSNCAKRHCYKRYHVMVYGQIRIRILKYIGFDVINASFKANQFLWKSIFNHSCWQLLGTYIGTCASSMQITRATLKTFFRSLLNIKKTSIVTVW